jgi:hypothetical protein
VGGRGTEGERERAKGGKISRDSRRQQEPAHHPDKSTPPSQCRRSSRRWSCRACPRPSRLSDTCATASWLCSTTSPYTPPPPSTTAALGASTPSSTSEVGCAACLLACFALPCLALPCLGPWPSARLCSAPLGSARLCWLGFVGEGQRKRERETQSAPTSLPSFLQPTRAERGRVLPARPRHSHRHGKQRQQQQRPRLPPLPTAPAPVRSPHPAPPVPGGHAQGRGRNRNRRARRSPFPHCLGVSISIGIAVGLRATARPDAARGAVGGGAGRLHRRLPYPPRAGGLRGRGRGEL